MSANERWGNVKALINQLAKASNDEDVSEPSVVLADWFEERGFDLPAEGFRQPPKSPLWILALSTARALFGDHAGRGQANSYSAVFGFPMTQIGPLQTVVLSTQSNALVKVKRIFVPSEVAQLIRVCSVRFGNMDALLNSEPVPGTLFGDHMPELFDRIVPPNQLITLTIENNCSQALEFQAAVLGESVEFRGGRVEELVPIF